MRPPSGRVTTGAMIMQTWLLGILLAIAPPGRVPERETEEAGRARYETIASDIAIVVSDPEEAPLFGGPFGRERTAALMVSVAYMESGLRVDVDDGRTRGDGGNSCGIYQLNRGRRECDALVRDRRFATQEALRSMRRSAAACRAFGIDGMLRVYAAGTCLRGAHESEVRVRFARRLFSLHPPPKG